MWNDDLLLAHAEAVIGSRKETQLYRGPVHYLIDSYGCHVKLADSKRLERYNIFVVLVPPNLTNMLQPLDVAVNRSYQEYYRSKYDAYISEALRDPMLQTKAGNPKVPRYDAVARWTLDWVASKDPAEVKKAFGLCGIVAKERFSMDRLHAPLKAILSSDFNMHAWHTAYQHLVNDDSERELVRVFAPDWYIPDNERRSLFCWLSFSLDMSVPEYAEALTTYMATLVDLTGLLDDEYLVSVRKGLMAPGELEIYAASKMHGWNITLKTVDEGSRLTSSFVYAAENATKDVVLVRGDGYFAVEIDGYLL
ncbi:hypothetical protein PHYSODRAFT_502885 [Phytophthora sojae]|uniref:DDE-1 domain-containing protein n=1 Tax=Phytophthora sojae (strain P6497) TaxID=1094619 RepID=G4ZHC5_PHYSP|nr:hypothetical protein PHYSODRAFT_502885 [Phytophthora sojae]EGZ17595.1 hypothetical protein PHYSODRAFT_502885 [Phytophthora sojae]|eukprot:XP_009526653.1 hypothetical protein PHYSODRAFT_502885 [Phytophthora sojae]